MVAPRFSGVLIVLSADEANPMFCITMIIFVGGLPRDFCDGLDFIATDLNEIE